MTWKAGIIVARHARLAGALLAAALVLGCRAEPAIPAPRRLFLISVDTLRADHMSLYGYGRATTPKLAELAGRGAVFERAISQWPKTGTSFASMMTGRYPQTTGLTHEASIRVPSSLPILSELFHGHGFTTLAVVSNAVLSKDLGWDRGFDEYVETWHGEMTEDPVAYRRLLYAGRVNELARATIERHRDADRLLVWVHYSDPHAPYLLPAEEPNPFLDDATYRAAPEVKVELGGRTDRKVGDADDLRFYVAQYDANIRVVDTKAAELIDWLGTNGLLEDAAIVFFADHGEDLGEHRHAYFEHGRFTYNATAHVPLFMVGPGIEPGRRVAQPVELVDLFPTLASWLLPDAAPEGLDGRSLLAAARGARPEGDDARHSVAFSEAGRRGRERLRSVQDARWKLIYVAPNRARPPRFELYDLEHDPREESNVGTAPENETHVRRLMRQLHDWMQGANPSAPREPRTEEQLKALKALGYVD